MLEKDDNPEAVFVRLQSGRVTIPVSKDFLATFERNCLQERQTSAVLCFMPTIPSTWDVPIIFTGRLAIFYMLIRT